MNASTEGTETPAAPVPKRVTIKVCGVGGAGCNAVGYIAQSSLTDVELFALNTDAQALERCAVGRKLVLGAARTRGLGAGGDPDVGRAAAEEDVEQMRALCTGADIVFILAGLGGGTGTGAAPVLARVAAEGGALVLGVVTLPFEFEGARRQRQAELGLLQLKQGADAVICLPNQKLFQILDEKTSVVEGFKVSNALLADGLRGVWRLLSQTGLINVDFADLCAVTRGRHAASSFATAEAGGDNRAEQALEKLFAHPLLDGGQLLGSSDTVLVSIVGGPDLTMAEVSKVMQPINRQAENAHVIFGAAIDEQYAGRLSVTLIASRQNGEDGRRLTVLPGPETATGNGSDLQFLDKGESVRPASRIIVPAPELSEEKKLAMLNRQSGRNRKRPSRLQKELPLEIVFKGRFERSEPTIRHGEDLDVPTYIRRGVPLN
ncbi:MAG TPA: cell division protein FtsZ [Verrucomicrobiae bacterium]|jgi:cell division protein FtsZ|nr:cell division protein FtsZ [Verrucomicrobiae bacterium]